MNRSTIIVALLGVAASTTNTIVVTASSIPAPSPATASDWADVADEVWGNAEGGGRSLESLSDMQRRRLSTSLPTSSPTTDTIYAGDTPTPNPPGVGEPVPATISNKVVITNLPAPSRRLSSSVQRDLASVSCSSLGIDSVAYKTQLDTQYCEDSSIKDDPDIDTCEVKNLKLTCETTGPTPSPTGITLTVEFDLDLVVKCSATPCDADAAEAAVTAAATVAKNRSNAIAGADTSIPTTSGGFITVAASDITITEEVTSNAEDFSKWYPLSYVGEDGNTCSNDGGHPGWLNTGLIKSSLKDCCKHNYNWAENDCVVDGGGNPASLEGYGDFYINYDFEADEQFCVKSCPEDTTGIENCAGIAENWEVAAGLYTTAEKCCDTFGWFGNGWDKEKCIYKSENADLDGYVYVGSGKFFVPWDWEGCLQDNADNEEKYENGVQEFTSQAECCRQVFGYVEDGDVTGCCEGGKAC